MNVLVSDSAELHKCLIPGFTNEACESVWIFSEQLPIDLETLPLPWHTALEGEGLIWHSSVSKVPMHSSEQENTQRFFGQLTDLVKNNPLLTEFVLKSTSGPTFQSRSAVAEGNISRYLNQANANWGRFAKTSAFALLPPDAQSEYARECWRTITSTLSWLASTRAIHTHEYSNAIFGSVQTAALGSCINLCVNAGFMFGFAWESVWEDTGIVLFGPTSVIRSRFAAIALADDDRVKKENELIAYGLCPMPLQ